MTFSRKLKQIMLFCAIILHLTLSDPWTYIYDTLINFIYATSMHPPMLPLTSITIATFLPGHENINLFLRPVTMCQREAKKRHCSTMSRL